MLYVMTVHWKDPRWIDPQLAALERHLQQPFRTLAFLNGIPERFCSRFDVSLTTPIIQHPYKLDVLATMACELSTSDDDLLMFIDGDAFPVADLDAYIADTLGDHDLAAVQRLENDGDDHPHPCFAVTTVGAWKRIGGTWLRPLDKHGQRAGDTGARLPAKLEAADASWHPMRRTNVVDLHPVWFGIYDSVVYHHGAGFRSPWSRADIARVDEALSPLSRGWSRLLGRLSWAGRWTRWEGINPSFRVRKRLQADNRAQQATVWRAIRDGENLLEMFQPIAAPNGPEPS